MICNPCRERNHRACDNLTKQGYEVPDPGTELSVDERRASLSGNWCDCQHVTEGTTINPEWTNRQVRQSSNVQV